jgi:hypothetical protein
MVTGAALIWASTQAYAGGHGADGAGFRPAEATAYGPVVRDHRRKPVVRDHRSEPVVRDHRSEPVVRDHRSEPVVRDHRSEPIVRDHTRSRSGSPGGVTVTSSGGRRTSSRCIRSVFGGPCIGLNWK